jgi:hypothetical protein
MIVSTLSGFFTKRLSTKNNGSLINLNPLSVDRYSLYILNIPIVNTYQFEVVGNFYCIVYFLLSQVCVSYVAF